MAASPRFDPFAFPPDTTFRFVLMIVAVIGASLFIFSALNTSLNSSRLVEQVERCGPLANQVHEARAAAGESEEAYQRFLTADDAYFACNAPYERTRAGWQLAGFILLLAVAAAIYWAMPLWITRRAGLEPLTSQDHPELLAYLEDLCREAGLTRPPRFLWNPLRGTSGGLAFGRRGRYAVMLSGGLVHQFATDRPAFRAVVLHELAHLRNADVDKTYFALALALAFVLVALGPYVAHLVTSITVGENWLFFLNILWRAAALGVLVYLTLAGVLRARELYADARAAQWEGPAGALGRIVAQGQRAPVRRRPWSDLLRFHPTAAERGQVLAAPERLAPLGFWVAFETGVAAAIAAESIQTLLFQVSWGLRLP